MLLLSPSKPCGVPRRGLNRLSTHVRPCEFGDSTLGCHGERNVSQETREREQALITSEVHEGQPSTFRKLEVPFLTVPTGREVRY